MQVHLHAEKIGLSHSLRIAVVDAIIWVWFYQTSHTAGEVFLASGGESWGGRGLMGLVITAIVLLLRWDRFPKHFRVVAPITTSVICLALTVLSALGVLADSLRLGLLSALAIGSFSCQLLRFDNLAHADNVRVLALAVTESLVLFYALNLVLAESSPVLSSIYLVAAPCILLTTLKDPDEPTPNLRPLSLKTLAVLPNVLVGAFGVAGGFVFVVGTLRTPTGLGDLLYSPMPTYPVMLLLYMAISIIVASGLRFPKAAYFSLVNLSWSVGIFLGNLPLRTGLQVPESISLLFAAAAMMSFFLFQSSWIDRPENMPTTPEQRVGELAEQYGLTKREVEVTALLLEGRSLRRIQTVLFISEGTAKTHVKHIYAKLGVRTKQELIDFFAKQP